VDLVSVYHGVQFYTGIIHKTMNDQQILERLQTIVKSINEGADINEKTALIGESILDSLEFMNYITKVEESFNLEISDLDITHDSLGVIGNMVIYIRTKAN
jgi:acyl carrier protein